MLLTGVSGQWSTLIGQRSIRAGFKLGLDRAWVGPVWAGLTQTRGTLWYSHVTSMGSYWAVVYGLRSTVDQEMLVHDPQTGLRWTESTLRLLGVVHVLRVHAQVADEGGCSPVPFPAAYMPAVSSL